MIYFYQSGTFCVKKQLFWKVKIQEINYDNSKIYLWINIYKIKQFEISIILLWDSQGHTINKHICWGLVCAFYEKLNLLSGYPATPKIHLNCNLTLFSNN